MARQFNASDADKTVFASDGTKIGTIETIKGGTAHVKPHRQLSQSMRRKLGWEGDEEVFELRSSHVQTYDDEGVHLKKL